MSFNTNEVHRSYRLDESRRMRRYAGWLPAHPAIHREFLHKHHEHGRTRMRSRSKHCSAVAHFKAAILADRVMVELFEQVFLQAARVPGIPAIENLDELLHQIDSVIAHAPPFVHATDEHGNELAEPVGVPLFLLFDLLINTQAAYDLFRMPAFNVAMKRLLDAWGEYLTSPDSASVLTDAPGGWFSPVAIQMLETNRGKFQEVYFVPDPTAIDRGYTSWDDFFIREVLPDARPIINANDKTIIYSPCEATVFNIAYDVKLHDQFWLKAQPYSLYDIFNRDDETAAKFVGGTVYQAFLSPQDYHRWRAPFNGTIRKTANVPGAYCAALLDEGAPANDPDLKPGDPHGAYIRSLQWLTVSSARALVFIESDNPDIGLMCFIAIGMTEVSTCEITVKEGDTVTAGDQIGMFHFGGSSHAMIFGPQVKITFADVVKPDEHVFVNSVLGQAHKKN
ncbi:phosphatidylserine decarboxylase [Panaeolus papilionaceus]|nr:phosphatidylserine decarboxylase [Panaeolus papilionaceus]